MRTVPGFSRKAGSCTVRLYYDDKQQKLVCSHRVEKYLKIICLSYYAVGFFINF